MRPRGEIVGLAMTGAVLVGCTSGSEALRETATESVEIVIDLPETAEAIHAPTELVTEVVEVPTVPVIETEALSETQRLEQYLASPERVERINTTIQEIGNRIIDLAESGEIGYFDAYNPLAGTWRSQQVDEGWVWLQHGEDYGGSIDQLAVTVWQNADGTFDRSRGILEVRLNDRTEGQQIGAVAELVTPGAFEIAHNQTVPEWRRPESSVSMGPGIEGIAFSNSAQTVEEAMGIDQGAITQLTAYFD